MRTSEAIGIIRGGTTVSSGALAGVAEILPIELLYNKEDDLKVQILAKNQPVRVSAKVDVITPFNSTGTDLLNVGTGAGTNIFNGQTIAAAGTFQGNAILLENVIDDIIINFRFSVADATAGRAMLYIEILPLVPVKPNDP
jgi:hypothetical protein